MKSSNFIREESKDKATGSQRTLGLYDAANEHDACGVGMIVDIHGNKSHELVDSALKVLENLKHRGAEGVAGGGGPGRPGGRVLRELTGGDMTELERARYARERLEASRRHVSDAVRALSVPEPDWVAARAAADMAVDVMPDLRGPRHADD